MKQEDLLVYFSTDHLSMVTAIIQSVKYLASIYYFQRNE